jgi:dTDP-4-amino-4,6-dideoxygalactose transaminase
MGVLAITGGSPVRKKPFPAWPQYDRAEERLLREVLCSRRWGTLGPKVAEFEDAFARYIGVNRCQTVSNGTVSLEVILRALDIGPGDEVIIPPYTFMATATAVLMVGAFPVFADVSPQTITLDPAAAEAAITSRTRAIIPVHMAGVPADMDALAALGDARGIPIVEDAAQAHGSEWKGRRLGSLGTAGSFSFQLSKNMTAGEGGGITTNDRELAERMWSIHHVGRRKDGLWYGHYELAGNYRLTDWQAGILIAQLGRLDRQIETRERNAARLSEELARIDGIQPFTRDPRATRITHHLYMFRYKAEAFGGAAKDQFVEALAAEGVPCSSGYVEIQKQPLFEHTSVKRILGRSRVDKLKLPVAEQACRQTVWIQQNALLGGEREIADIVSAIRKIQEHHGELGDGGGA